MADRTSCCDGESIVADTVVIECLLETTLDVG